MHILILEDEPIIAIDLEDILISSRENTTCILANTVEAALEGVRSGVDFALLDLHVGRDRKSSLVVAEALSRHCRGAECLSASLQAGAPFYRTVWLMCRSSPSRSVPKTS